ncbi:MAG: 23S rRNA (guanosine(2251)-2'-O)-methyltransferase RlmB [Bacteroidetes bacterium]|nr:23S rRNA (guanosine(2251)-2'-O)-methyltransferase RlmB [Bacteroidota bacterium]
MNKENIIYGLRPVIEAINSGQEIEKLFIQSGLRGELYFKLISLARKMAIPFQPVPISKLNRLTSKNHQGVVAYISPIIYQSVENLIPLIYEQGQTPLLLILDRITDVRNFGAIVRTAECAGVHAIVIPSKGSALIHADAIKTSAGALYKIPVCRSRDLYKTILFLRNSGVQIIAGTEKSDLFYHEPDYSNPTAIILGSESDGISEDFLRLADKKVKIPLFGEIESLNVSVAAGIIMYEAVKQRTLHA